MSGYLPDDIITNARAMFQKHHETFAVDDIVVFQKAKPIIASENSSYNFLFQGNTNSENITYEQISGVYKARVRLPENQKTTQFGTKQDRRSEDQLNVSLPDGMCRIIVDPTGAAAVRTAERIIIRDKIYNLESEEAQKGFLTHQFSTFYLKLLK